MTKFKFEEVVSIKIYECKLNENDFWTLESFEYSEHSYSSLLECLKLDLGSAVRWCKYFTFDCEEEKIILHVSSQYDSLELISQIETLLGNYLEIVKNA